jgi:hypothetical protein
MFALAVKTLGSEAKASFAVNELLPLLAAGNQKESLELLNRTFEESRRSKNNRGHGGSSEA